MSRDWKKWAEEKVIQKWFRRDNLIVLVLAGILLEYRHRRFKGEICLLYLGGYGIIRFFVEGIRTDRLKLAGTDIAVSQLLGIVLFLTAVAADITVRFLIRRKKKTGISGSGKAAADIEKP